MLALGVVLSTLGGRFDLDGADWVVNNANGIIEYHQKLTKTFIQHPFHY